MIRKIKGVNMTLKGRKNLEKSHMLYIDHTMVLFPTGEAPSDRIERTKASAHIDMCQLCSLIHYQWKWEDNFPRYSMDLYGPIYRELYYRVHIKGPKSDKAWDEHKKLFKAGDPGFLQAIDEFRASLKTLRVSGAELVDARSAFRERLISWEVDCGAGEFYRKVVVPNAAFQAVFHTKPKVRWGNKQYPFRLVATGTTECDQVPYRRYVGVELGYLVRLNIWGTGKNKVENLEVVLPPFKENL